jgi:cell division protein FtsZ
METAPLRQNDNPKSPSAVRLRAFGVGNAGINVLDLFISSGFNPADAVACDTSSVTCSAATEKVRLDLHSPRKLGLEFTADQSPMLSEEQAASLAALCSGIDVIFIIAGLGGATGTALGPVLARLAKESGALVLGFVTTPFDCEGSRRKGFAEEGITRLQAAADGLVCLPNQKVLKLIDENTSVVDAFKSADQLLADAVRGIWRLLTQKGLIDIHFADLCALLRDQHNDCAFAVAEAAGATRSRDVLERLLAHPLLDDGAILADANAVLVSLIGGPDLTMTEVRRVMEEINGKCDGAQLTMGAAVHEDFRDRLAVTLIASRKGEPPVGGGARRGEAESLQDHLLQGPPARGASRFVPPPPTLPPEQVQRMLSRQSRPSAKPHQAAPKLRQTQLPLEIVSKGRFDKSEPTIHKGEDLDVPTYIRRGVALN